MIRLKHSAMSTASGDSRAAAGPSFEAQVSAGRLRGLRFTWLGFLGVVVMSVVAFGALSVDSNLLFLLSGMYLGTVLVSAWLSWRSVGGLSVSRILPGTLVAGQEFRVGYRLRNRGRHRARSVWIRERFGAEHLVRIPDTYVPAVEPDSTVLVEQRGLALRRGRATPVGLELRTRFPFELVRRRVAVSLPAIVTILPRLLAVRHNPAGDRYRQVGRGNRPLRHRGGVDDFMGLREYRPGDNPRWIHWRRSARTGQLLIREMFPFAAAEYFIIVDHRLAGPRPEDDVRRELVVGAAASLACHCLERRTQVGLIGLGASPVAIPPVSGRAHQTRILNELAMMSDAPADRLAEQTQRSRMRTLRGSHCFLFTSRRDEQTDELEVTLRRAGAEVTVYVPDTELFEAVFGPLGQASDQTGPNPDEIGPANSAVQLTEPGAATAQANPHPRQEGGP